MIIQDPVRSLNRRGDSIRNSFIRKGGYYDKRPIDPKFRFEYAGAMNQTRFYGAGLRVVRTVKGQA
jgi:hypothetical protein